MRVPRVARTVPVAGYYTCILLYYYNILLYYYTSARTVPVARPLCVSSALEGTAVVAFDPVAREEHQQAVRGALCSRGEGRGYGGPFHVGSGIAVHVCSFQRY